MFTTLISKYPGTCKRCHLAFETGTRIRYGGKGRTYHLKADCPASTYADEAPAGDTSYPSEAQLQAAERRQMGITF